MPLKFTVFQESRKGTRRYNQDRQGYCYTRESLLLVLADGMGGHLNGEIAAQIAVQSLTESFQREARPRLADPLRFLREGFLGVHRSIHDYAESARLKEPPRTTCVACVVQDSLALWAHAGDSRLYHLREGRILAQTRDHSRVQMLVDQGRIREEAVAVHPERNRIWNCLGGAQLPQVDVSNKTALFAGDTLLLCSDGLWGPLTPRIIEAALLGGEIGTAVPALLGEAERRAGRDCDNLSAVAITWADNFAGTLPGDVSTQPLEIGTVETRVEPLGKNDAAHVELTDAEIERAIEEIRLAIRKHTTK